MTRTILIKLIDRLCHSSDEVLHFSTLAARSRDGSYRPFYTPNLTKKRHFSTRRDITTERGVVHT
jgi:hypothetical protein